MATPDRTPGAIRAVFWDLDGTLLDSFEDIADALNHGLAALGLPTHPLDRVKSFVGEGIGTLVRRALGEAHAARFDEVLPLVRDYYVGHPVGKSRMYPGADSALRALRGRGIKQAILTNKPHPIALESCARVGLAALVDVIQGEDESHPLKPNPASALEIARAFGAAPGECVVIGDGRADAELARAAGMAFIGCAWGVSSAADLTALRAAAVLDRFDALPSAMDAIELQWAASAPVNDRTAQR